MSTSARPGATHGWRIGSLAGTPVYLGRSWPLIIVLLVAVVAPSLTGSGHTAGYAIVVAVASALLLLLSVLVHEAAHALVAQWRGHGVDRIVADVWGGHTVYDSTGVTPLTNALVAVVGPVANLVLALVAWLAQPLATSDLADGLLGAMTYTNLFVGLFNLLPGLPLDGGQIVSSLVWRATGRKGTGLTAAGWLGRVVAVGSVLWFVGRPLLAGQQPTSISLVWTAMIAFFLWRGASQAVRSGQIHDATAGPATDVVEPVRLVPATTPLGDLEAALAGSAPSWVAVTDGAGWPFALIEPAALAAVPAEQRPTTPVSAVAQAQPEAWVVSLQRGAVLTDLVRVMSERSLAVAVVVDETTRHVVGVATAQRINDVVGAELARRGRR
jgi:Zn-dependent protease